MKIRRGRERGGERERERERQREREKEKERWLLRGCGPVTLTYFLFLFSFSLAAFPFCLLIGKLLVLYSFFLHFTCTYMCNDVYPYTIDNVIYFSSWAYKLISNHCPALNEIECVRNIKWCGVYSSIDTARHRLFITLYLLSCTTICLMKYEGNFSRLEWIL